MKPDLAITSSLPSAPAVGEGAPGAQLVQRVSAVGERLSATLRDVVAGLPGAPSGPVAIARQLRVDKVLTSRVLKALRARDPLSVVQLVPGPDPLRRLLRAAARSGVSAEAVANADEAVDAFAQLIRSEVGDRSALRAILSGLLPESRQSFELGRKQAAFRAMSQLKGVAGRLNLATVMLHPSQKADRLDVLWFIGGFGLQRLRPGVPVKFASRRLGAGGSPRRVRTLAGDPVDELVGLESLRLDRYCSSPPPRLQVQQAGEVVHYTLADHGFGPDSSVDLIFAELSLEELDRFSAGPGRRTYFFAEVPIPVEALLFDVLLHDEVFPGGEPTLAVYDTVLEGIASVNDRARDIDRLDLAESILPLGQGLARFRSTDAPAYTDMLEFAASRLGWNGARFRGYRCRIDYPMYGSQVTMSFDAPPRPR